MLFLLGNMSYPMVNRWGLNLFWYRLWFNDRIQTLLYQQDSIIEQLLYIYLHFGSFQYRHFILASYWFDERHYKLKQFLDASSQRMFRVVEYKSKTISDNRSYRLRTSAKNMYYSRVWVLRFQNWLVINFYFFQPLKVSSRRALPRKRELGATLTPFLKDFKFIFLRKKLFFFYTLQSMFALPKFYRF
jgi:hypothetical protein